LITLEKSLSPLSGPGEKFSIMVPLGHEEKFNAGGGDGSGPVFPQTIALSPPVALREQQP